MKTSKLRIIDRNTPTMQSENFTNLYLSVDFDHPELFNLTIPKTCIIQGYNIVPDKQNWSRLLVYVTEYLINKKKSNITKLSKTAVYGSKYFFMPQKPSSGASSLLSNGKWIYTGYNPRIIITIIKNICLHCGVDLNNVSITCIQREDSASTIKKKSIQDNISLFVSSNSLIDEYVKANIIAILKEHFPNGIRTASIIDTNKFKKYYIEATGNDLQDAGIDITSILETVGISHDEKIYAIPAVGRLSLVDLFNKYLAKGHRLFYYDEFCKAHPELMQEMLIFTPELLRTVLKGLPLKLYYYKRYCVTDKEIRIKSEILRCYETSSILSWEEVKAKLPFVPLAKIKHIVMLDDNLIRVSKSVYTHIGTVIINDTDFHRAQQNIENEISKHDYASLATIDVSASLESNPGLSESSVKNGLFQNFLANKYEKRGNIIMQKGKAPKSTIVLEDFCLSKDIIKRKDLVRFEKDIRGHSTFKSLEIAYNKMIRINKNSFVADNKLNFNIDAVDNALALFVTEKVIPLCAVTSFTCFPYISDYQWNLFLLESYCRRFSRRFAFCCQLPNNRNIGAIFRKDAGFYDLIDVLAHAVAIASVPQTVEAVGEFLVNNQYIGKRTSIISKVIEKTHKL